MIRRLNIDDTELLREACRWDMGRPSWYMQMDAVFNSGTEDDLMAQLGDFSKAFIGVWDEGEFTAVVIIEQQGEQAEGHLMARTGTDPHLLEVVIGQLLDDLFNLGLREACCWIAERNTSVRKLCDNIGFRPDGYSMYKGAYRGRVIRWLRYCIQRAQVSKAA
jgi:hypothetical protein